MRFIYLIIFIVLSSQNLWAQMYYVNPAGLSGAQSENFQNHLLIVNKRLPRSYKRIKDINIRFNKFKVRNKVHMAHYNRWQNELVINIDIIPSKGFSIDLHKTIIHELTHVYEDRVKEHYNDLKFLYTSGWHKRGLFFNTVKQRNFLKQRSPDTYEFSHPRETLAVNMEYFLSQKDFKCRRPLLYEYFVKEIEHIPFKDYKCKEINKVPVFVKGRPFLINIDPERIYEVHYLLAAKGDEVVSGFGHSMLRLVMCAPHRKQKSKKCLNDFDSHIVLSYRANITDTVLSYWSGLTGKYPSQLFLLNWVDVIAEYNKQEFRDLYSYPLKMTSKEIRRTFTNVMNEVWTYQGKYRFITQNCATETMDFLKVVMDNTKLLKKRVKTPYGVLEDLEDLQITYDDYDQITKGVEGKYVYKNKRDLYTTTFEKINNYFLQYNSLEEFLKDSSAKERRNSFEQAIKEGEGIDVLSAFLNLEMYIDFVTERDFLSSITKLIADSSKIPQFLKDFLNLRVRMEAAASYSEVEGFGIPNEEEFDKIEYFFEELSDEVKDNEKIQKWFLDNFKKIYLEKQEIKENKIYFKKRLIEKIKRRKR